jgi:hypothetical protein
VRASALPYRESLVRTLRQFGPTLLLLGCMFNWWWSLHGDWALSLGSVQYSYLDVITVTKGLFSVDGRLYFANSAKWGIYAGIGSHRPPPVTVVSLGPAAQCAFHRRDVFRDGAVYLLPLTEWDAAAERSGFSRFGFAGVWEPETQGWGLQRGVSVPWWFFVAVFAISPMRSAVRIWTRRQRPRDACRRCGYDLRATPDRCPECGTSCAPAAGT